MQDDMHFQLNVVASRTGDENLNMNFQPVLHVVERHAFSPGFTCRSNAFSAGCACRSIERHPFSAGFACRSIERRAFSAGFARRYDMDFHLV